MKHDNAFSVVRLWRALGYSLAGLRSAWVGEAAFRLGVILAVVLVPLGLWLGTTGVERALLAGSVLLIPLVELLNSAIEAVVDLASPELHPKAKQAKDMGSAAVLCASVIAALVWAAILL